MKRSQAIGRLVIRRSHKTLATEDSYVFWVVRYINSLRSIPPELPSEKKLEIFLTGLALRLDCSIPFSTTRPDPIASQSHKPFNPLNKSDQI